MNRLSDWLFVVEQAKILNYLLDPTHVVGGSKARFFLVHGFTRDNPEQLASALANHGMAGWPGLRRPGVAGPILRMSGPTVAPRGTEPTIVTVWEESADIRQLRLVTAHPG